MACGVAFRGTVRRLFAPRMCSVFGFFNKKRKPANPNVARNATESVRPEDLAYLKKWSDERALVEGFIEPATLVNEMSIVLVDVTGESTRRRIGGAKGVDVIARELGIPIYDVEETGYPQRMRDRIEYERLMRKREERRLMREQMEREKEQRDR